MTAALFFTTRYAPFTAGPDTEVGSSRPNPDTIEGSPGTQQSQDVAIPPRTDTTTSQNQNDRMPMDDYAHHTASGLPLYMYHQNDAITAPPPPYKSAAAPSSNFNDPSRILEGPRLIRVAMLPRDAPSGGFAYMDGVEHDVSFRASRNSRAASIYPYRKMKSLIDTRRASKKRVYTDESGKTMTTSLLDGIGPGEVERPIVKTFDWTRDWDFLLSMRNQNRSGKKWTSVAHLYFNDLSVLGCGAIPWNDASKTQRLAGDVLPMKIEVENQNNPWFRFTWKYCERSDHPRWGGSFTVNHEDCWALMGINHPWVFFNPNLVIRAEMNRRTGAGRYKKVMWYDWLLGYGNDLLNEPVETCNDRHLARCAQFTSRFLPRQLSGS